MSGIVGIINTDGAPVDRDLLVRLTASLDYRGPDARAVWVDGHVGFGHTMLRTTDESVHERQPLSLDGSVWITGRPRGRAGGAATRAGRRTCCRPRHRDRRRADPACVSPLGHSCVDHLLGDFAFAIWVAGSSGCSARAIISGSSHSFTRVYAMPLCSATRSIACGSIPA